MHLLLLSDAKCERALVCAVEGDDGRPTAEDEEEAVWEVKEMRGRLLEDWESSADHVLRQRRTRSVRECSTQEAITDASATIQAH